MIYEKRTLYVFKYCHLYHQEPDPVKNVHDARFFTDENEVFEVMGEDALSAGECIEVEVTVATPPPEPCAMRCGPLHSPSCPEGNWAPNQTGDEA